MKSEKRHANIPVFIPHLGCPNMCVFCNQRFISGKNSFDCSKVKTEIETALSTIKEKTETEIAFFGGSFTGIDKDLMIYLLDLANDYFKSGKVKGIRISTRPDYISSEILEILKKYPISLIELGIQSMDNKVLLASKRGHTAEHSINACHLITEYGFNFIGQMMIGLPKADVQSEIATADAICSLGASGARIYPTVVFQGTELASMFAAEEYTPLDTETAVERTKNVLSVFVYNKIPVIRVGLCSSENLASDESVMGGASHAAIGEMAMGELYYDIIYHALNENDINRTSLTIIVPKGEVSKAVGQRKRNVNRLKINFSIRNIIIREDTSLEPYRIKIIR